MADLASHRSPPPDRVTVARTVHDLIHGLTESRSPPGTSIVIEGAPGIGKTHLSREITDAVPPGAARVVLVAGEPGRRNDPFTAAGQLLRRPPAARDPGDEAFDRVDELCAAGPVVLCADDAHHLDGASLTLLRRLMWASRSLPLAVVVTARPDPSRAALSALVRQAQVRLVLPPMGRMLVERLVFDQAGRWPGPRLRGALELAAGNPLFVIELLRAYQNAGALAEAGPEAIEARFDLDLRATGLNEVIKAHLTQLDEPARDVLGALAVWGSDVAVTDLGAMLPGTAHSPGALVDQATSSGLVRLDPAGTIGFTHDLFREVTYGELAEPSRRAMHARAARLLQAAGYRPTLVADHLLRASQTGTDPALVTALHDAVAATRGSAPEVTADLLDDVAALTGSDVPEALLPDHAQALFLRGRGESAETLIRTRITTVTDPAVAAQLQLTLIRSLVNRAATTAAQAAIEHTITIPGVPGAARRQLEALRAWLLIMSGQPLPGSELDALMARFTAAGDRDAQASLLSAYTGTAFLSGRLDDARDFLRARDALGLQAGSFRSRSSAVVLLPLIELAGSGPPAARVAVERARQQSAERDSGWAFSPAGSPSPPGTGTTRWPS
jgi:hypothetical protein